MTFALETFQARWRQARERLERSSKTHEIHLNASPSSLHNALTSWNLIWARTLFSPQCRSLEPQTVSRARVYLDLFSSSLSGLVDDLLTDPYGFMKKFLNRKEFYNLLK